MEKRIQELKFLQLMEKIATEVWLFEEPDLLIQQADSLIYHTIGSVREEEPYAYGAICIAYGITISDLKGYMFKYDYNYRQFINLSTLHEIDEWVKTVIAEVTDY